MKQLLLPVFLFALLTSDFAGAASTTFTETEFIDWNVDGTYGSIASAAAAKPKTGGNPDRYYRTYLGVSGSFNQTPKWIIEFYSDDTAIWNPANQGAIATIDFAVDSIMYTPPGLPVELGLSLSQGGRYFVNRGYYANPGAWQTQNKPGLSANDFVAFIKPDPRSVGTGFDEAIHPVFSALGGPILFGNFRRVESTRTVESAGESGMDNWVVTVTPAPEPSTAALLAIGVVAIRRRRLIGS